MTLQTVLAEFSTSRYSRYPWFDVDGEQVLGILHTKDILVAMARGQTLDALRPLLRPATVLALESPIPRALEQFRSGATHLALCVDEHGRILGFFTLEDLLEVVVGEIEDEHRHVVRDAPVRGQTARCWWPAAPRSFAWNACWAAISARPTRSIRLAA